MLPLVGAEVAIVFFRNANSNNRKTQKCTYASAYEIGYFFFAVFKTDRPILELTHYENK